MKGLFLTIAFLMAGCFSIDNVVLPYTFYQDSIIYASQFNANFDTLTTNINNLNDTIQNKFARKGDTLSSQTIKADTIKGRSGTNLSIPSYLLSSTIHVDTIKNNANHYLYIGKKAAYDSLTIGVDAKFIGYVDFENDVNFNGSTLTGLTPDSIHVNQTNHNLYISKGAGGGHANDSLVIIPNLKEHGTANFYDAVTFYGASYFGLHGSAVDSVKVNVDTLKIYMGGSSTPFKVTR